MQTRHDPYYYLPKFVRLEARVTARSTARLRDYVLALSGGSTPKKEEKEKYYADAESGIPFVRVQNLNVDGHLSLDDVKYVNRETHEGLLNRSKVLQDDLLVKITGVGRMAVASVPPIGFEGNINQHIACIRTESRAMSEALAAWLNTDIAETLAKRRSTGGTRPALDYPALRSIPVILDAQVQKELSEAYAQYKQAEAKANELLAGIDDYLLSELGITLLPEPANTIASRIFTAQRKELAGWRFDPQALHPERELCIDALRRLNSLSLKSACHFVRDLRAEIPEGATYIGLENIESNTGRFVPSSEKDSVSSAFAFRKGQVLFPKLRPYLNKVFFAPFDGLCSTEFHVLEGHSVSSDFLALFLRSQVVVKQTKHLMSGNTLPRLQTEDIEDLLIPVVDPALQEKIVIEANRRMIDADNLRSKAESELNTAKHRIETMLLGEVTA
ncbi:restriction endonuclease subunit S [Aeromonas dhakensis]|uniref:restriction endonuclease subunit S n=1 Tax=Aeromonas dhakensis TaxID=196024 RepID=UPI0021583382|nr:restriction endonuclease subunit S [Aeromonas dhakensis]MCR6741242.1 restriction endonuclease subunit S [Aeromonas dhakensis]